jgi:Uma2 family endonuclease
VIVEVMSPSSAPWDRDGKFKLYRQLASVHHYLLVATTHWEIDHYRRLPDDSWRLSSHGPGGTVVLDAIGVTLDVDEVYAKVEDAGGPARTAARPTGPARS